LDEGQGRRKWGGEGVRGGRRVEEGWRREDEEEFDNMEAARDCIKASNKP